MSLIIREQQIVIVVQYSYLYSCRANINSKFMKCIVFHKILHVKCIKVSDIPGKKAGMLPVP